MSDVQVFQGEGAQVLRSAVAPRSVDMVYADPPSFTQQEWTGTAGTFTDRWTWDEAAVKRWTVLRAADPLSATLLEASAFGDREMLSYLAFAEELVRAVHRCLKPTGTFWLHCDDAVGAHLRLVCELVFGPQRYWGEVIWKRTSSHNNANTWGCVHDVISIYARSGAALERLAPRGRHPFFAVGRQRQGWCEIDGVRAPRLWGWPEDQLNQAAKERLGYPTQKPLSLLRPLIETATRPGDLVVDPCCGSGTTLEAAWQLDRKAIGIDISAEAVALSQTRAGRNTHQADLFEMLGAGT